MAKRDLYDASVRLQIFIEALKVNFQLLFNPVFVDLSSEVKALIYALEKDSLDELTKRQLELLVAKIHRLQIKLYREYVGNLTDEMKDFAEALGEVVAAIYEVELQQAKDIWANIISEPIGANGTFVGAFVQSFAASGVVQTENMIRKAYANARTKTQTVEEVLATLNKIRFQSNAVTNTNVQHIASMVSQNYASGKWGKYRWISVIDSSTTEICLERGRDGGKVYVYGEGPLPPAHIGCRSLIVPYDDSQNTRAETLFSFLSSQSTTIQNLALGSKVGAMFRAGKVKAAELTKLANPPALTIADFKKSLSLILEG
ncbi:MAG TPA: hypothetical protein VHK27_05630 [Gammaproteobacteria bacterium]|nr:hypothetical protein [Gammaproteobacteria bacterium]